MMFVDGDDANASPLGTPATVAGAGSPRAAFLSEARTDRCIICLEGSDLDDDDDDHARNDEVRRHGGASAAQHQRGANNDNNSSSCFGARPSLALLCCGVALHTECLSQWMLSQPKFAAVCPQCRAPLVRRDGGQQQQQQRRGRDGEGDDGQRQHFLREAVDTVVAVAAVLALAGTIRVIAIESSNALATASAALASSAGFWRSVGSFLAGVNLAPHDGGSLQSSGGNATATGSRFEAWAAAFKAASHDYLLHQHDIGRGGNGSVVGDWVRRGFASSFKFTASVVSNPCVFLTWAKCHTLAAEM